MKINEDRNRQNERNKMVQEQLIKRGIKEVQILDAFMKIPRQDFVPERYESVAYDDRPVSIGENQTISQPYIVAVMLELLDLEVHEKVLEIGTGSGYQTALLSSLVKEVYTIERIPLLFNAAKERLSRMGYESRYEAIHGGDSVDTSPGTGAPAPEDRGTHGRKSVELQNIHFKLGDGTRGWKEFEPYDAIIVGAGAPKIPQPLLDQLDEGGRLVMPEGDKSQVLIRVKRRGHTYAKESFSPCVFVPLIGEYGWKE